MLRATLFAGLAGLLCATNAIAATPTPLPSPTEPTPPARVVRFKQRPTQVGDRAAQELSVALEMTTRFTQDGQVAHESESTMRREQQRLIEVLEFAGGAMRRARVAFPVSRRQLPSGPAPAELQSQPIEGKTYFAVRDGDRLTVTNLHGEMPPLEEFTAAAESLESLGKPNLLANFLLERPVRVGERLLVPRAIARALLGVGDELGAIKRFELRLDQLEPPPVEGASPQAVFTATIETMPNDVSPVSLTVAGQVVIETETSRTLLAELSGPVQMQSLQQTPGGVVHYSAEGSLKIAIRSQFGTVK